MRILILGAGGIGGYFGARLHDAGGDVTFLVRPARVEHLESHGLHVSSVLGDTSFVPKVTTSEELEATYDLVILSCKSYDLDSAMDAVSPAVGNGAILPLLNGVAHLDALDTRFPSRNVLGGIAHLSVSAPSVGTIKHLNGFHRLVVGARGSDVHEALPEFLELLSATSLEFSRSEQIESDMWSKFVFLSALAGATCTMRAPVGDILDTVAGESFILGLLRECEQVSSSNGYPLSADQQSSYRALLTERGSGYAASMLRDIERGGPTEADHILGDMIRRGESRGIDSPMLKLAYSHLQAYAFRRAKRAA